MHVENKPILSSDVTNIIWGVYLNYQKINTNSQKFIPKSYFFELKGFIQKFSTTKSWSRMVLVIVLVIVSIRMVVITNLPLAFLFHTDVVASFIVNSNMLATTHTITHIRVKLSTSLRQLLWAHNSFRCF